MKRLHKQSGIGFFSFIFWAALLCSIVIVGLQVTPIVNEYLSIKRGINKAKNETDERAIRNAFDNYARATYISDFDSRQLDISASNGLTTIRFAYDRKLHLLGPVSLLFNFSGEEVAR